jgi:hypothetical protein
MFTVALGLSPVVAFGLVACATKLRLASDRREPKR